MKNLPRFSIITPSLNQGKFIERTILSILNQDYSHVEYIVIDGGSTDRTLEILKKYDGQLTWKSEPDRGQAHAINKGLRMATGDILAYLNSDDTYKTNAMALIAQHFDQSPDISMVYGDCDIIDENDKQIGIFEGVQVNYRKMLFTNIACIPQQTAFWRKDIMDSVGYFDERLHHVIDTDFFIRVIRKHRAIHIPVNYANHRWQPMSKSAIEKKKELNKFKQERMLIQKKHGMQYVLYYYLRFRMFSRPRGFIFQSRRRKRDTRGHIRFHE